jgi:membrane associated rhomboid family serine protease
VYKENDDADLGRPFRLCEQCGRPTPVNLAQCVNCGAISIQSVVAEEQERVERRYARALFSRATPVTYALLVANVFVSVLMMIVYGGTEDSQSLIAFGAKTNALLQSGEWFRLVTPIFIHAGLLHLLLNSYALWVVGIQVEKLYGSARFLLIYLLSGVGGVAGSYLGQAFLSKPADAPSVGASGAIFGLFGVLAVFGFRYRHEMPPAIRRAMTAGVLPVIVINLFIGFSIPFIDNSAHIGGLLTGAALTLVIPYIAPGRERVSKLGLAIIAVCVVVVIYCFAQAYRANRSHNDFYSFPVGINSVEEAMEGAMLRAFDSDLNSASGQERESAATKLAAAIEKLQNTRTHDAKSDQIRRDLLLIAQRQYTLLTSPALNKNEMESNQRDYQKVLKRLEDWVETEGSKYGIEMSNGDKRK